VEIRTGAIRAGLETLYYSGVHHLARRMFAGVGTILTFHRVRPHSGDSFQPNHSLEVTPAFLADTIRALRAQDIEIVSINEAHRRLAQRDYARRFAVLTFDDGYRDNLVHAWPVLKRYNAPFVVYVASAFADGDGMLWWMALEESIARSDRVAATINGVRREFNCATPAAKAAAWEVLYDHLAGETDETRARATVREIALASGVDPAAQCRDTCMSWGELAGLAEDPLVTIGAHTMSHPILGRLKLEEARAEIEDGARRIAAKLGVRPLHFAYPVGNVAAAAGREFTLAAEAGFKTAVTTRPGMLFPGHRDTPMALPRVSVNGEFQRRRYLDVLLSGAATALWNGFRRVNAA
jgi:peptidoglycan/xylan/chitin deacetylase (PgdA/CDA1 family)